MDGRRNNGGARPGAGRKPRVDEQELNSLLDKGWPQADRLKAIQKLAAQAIEGDREAFKILAAYTFGTPKATVDLNHGGSITTNYQVEIGGARETADTETQYIN